MSIVAAAEYVASLAARVRAVNPVPRPRSRAPRVRGEPSEAAGGREASRRETPVSLD